MWQYIKRYNDYLRRRTIRLKEFDCPFCKTKTTYEEEKAIECSFCGNFSYIETLGKNKLIHQLDKMLAHEQLAINI